MDVLLGRPQLAAMDCDIARNPEQPGFEQRIGTPSLQALVGP